MKQKVIKTGNSLGVTVPSDFVKTVGVKKGDEVEVKIEKEKFKVSYQFSGICQMSLLEEKS